MKTTDNFTEALAAVERTPEVATFDNSAPWPVEPSELLVKAEMQRGTPRDEAYAKVQAQMVAGARRLAAFAPRAAAEIQKAVTTANRAAEEAEAVIAAQNAAESEIVNQIIQLGSIRQKISIVKKLDLPADVEKGLAQAALRYFILKTEAPTVENSSGWDSMAHELVIRIALKKHVGDFTEPLEQQAKNIITQIKSSASTSGIDLQKLMALLFRERGSHGGLQLSGDSDLYAGLI